MSTARRLYVPQPAAVEADAGGRPRALEGVAVEAIREDWLVEDQWWAERPVHRHYYELALADGRNVMVFFDLLAGHWRRQRA